ncbi:hypothetical protein ACXYMW_19350 [Roseivivax sp. CAU 1761]
MTNTEGVVQTSASFFIDIDIEASSLVHSSWPIEIGVARIEEGVIVSEGRRIWTYASGP